METSGDIDWTAFGDGPAILERPFVEAGECRAISSVAGLQFYGYHRPDGLDGRVVPLPGDRLTLVRRPDKLADPNVVEVWWRNSHQLGHLPRRDAKSVAPRIDLGESVRAYVWDSGIVGGGRVAGGEDGVVDGPCRGIVAPPHRRRPGLAEIVLGRRHATIPGVRRRLHARGQPGAGPSARWAARPIR